MANKAINPNYAAIAADLVKAHQGEMTVKAALMKHGWTEGQANKGWNCLKVNKALKTAFDVAIRDDYEKFASEVDLSPELDAKLVNSRLRRNIREGTDKAVQSCKTLGSRKDLAMWQPDSITGVIVIESPRTLPVLPVDSGEIIDAQQ